MTVGTVRGIFLARLDGEDSLAARLGDEGFVFDLREPPPPPMTRAELGLPPRWLLPVFVAGFAAWLAGPGALKLWTWPRVSLPHIPLPAAIDSEPARVVAAFFLVALVLILVVVAIIVMRFARRRSWSAARGRIVESRRGEESFRDLSTGGTRIRAVPVVRYTYTVGGVAYSGHKIDAGEGVAEEEIDGTLARYPVGAEVAVFHDPKDPARAVLEREVPKYVAKGCLAGVGIAFVALLLLMWLLTNGPSLARGALPNANLPVFLISAVIGVIALGVTFLIVRTSEAARNWPRVRGRIVASGIRSRSSRQLRVVYYPWVRYDYTVEGRAFSAAVLKVGIEVGGSRRYAEKIVSRYPVGAIVDVSYDPKSPGNAALEHGSGLAWILPLIAGAALAIAAFASGLFGG